MENSKPVDVSSADPTEPDAPYRAVEVERFRLSPEAEGAGFRFPGVEDLDRGDAESIAPVGDGLEEPPAALTPEPVPYVPTQAGQFAAAAEERLGELADFLRERFGVRVENVLNAPQLAIAKLQEQERRLVRVARQGG